MVTRATSVKKKIIDIRKLLNREIDVINNKIRLKFLKKQFKRAIRIIRNDKDHEKIRKIENIAKNSNKKTFWKEIKLFNERKLGPKSKKTVKVTIEKLKEHFEKIH